MVEAYRIHVSAVQCLDGIDVIRNRLIGERKSLSSLGERYSPNS